MGKEPRAVTTMEMPIGISLLRNVWVTQFCRKTEKSREAMEEASGTEASAIAVSYPSGGSNWFTTSRYKGIIVAVVLRETLANM